MAFFFFPQTLPSLSKFALLLFILYSPVFAQRSETIRGKVVAISDGDSFTLLTPAKKQVKIRLHGVDCPESKQDFGTRAQQFTSALIFGKQVRVDVTTTDRYGRKVAMVYLPDGRLLNKELLKYGFAWHYTFYDKSAEMAMLEQRARKYRLGLWAAKNPIAPWQYRKEKREAHRRNNPRPRKLCTALTKLKKPCKNPPQRNSKTCWQHRR